MKYDYDWLFYTDFSFVAEIQLRNGGSGRGRELFLWFPIAAVLSSRPARGAEYAWYLRKACGLTPRLERTWHCQFPDTTTHFPIQIQQIQRGGKNRWI
jgi:glycine/D-amino acid oxidase-like deaminating enzyme